LFQWAPTLGGECYTTSSLSWKIPAIRFNGHPPLGVNATLSEIDLPFGESACFNGHPPLGVNATLRERRQIVLDALRFQWAPTLGGECYADQLDVLVEELARFNGHPPLGVNATFPFSADEWLREFVSMGTHPWG